MGHGLTSIGGAQEQPHVAALAPTVLVVEDETLIRLAVAEYLRECGFRVREARTGDEAIAILQAGVQVDIVFSDVDMPGSLNGFALARRIRAEFPRIKVILSSGVARKADAGRDLGEFVPFLSKPYPPGELVRTIQLLLAERIDQESVAVASRLTGGEAQPYLPLPRAG